jgi:hypothetical protein
MRLADFTPEQQRYVIRTPAGHLAFVPPPLPHDLDLSKAAIAALAGWRTRTC